jgi:hypothetical protein
MLPSYYAYHLPYAIIGKPRHIGKYLQHYRVYEILDPAESAIADCTGHQFLAVQQPDCWQADSVEGLRTWMNRMLQVYPIATDF